MVRRLRVTILLLIILLASVLGGYARDLTIEERIEAQRAIERVYYSHQLNTATPFEEVVLRSRLEEKVRTYLKQSVALQEIWNTPVTAEMLRREQERMEAHTRIPVRLRELYAALGDDPLLIQECLVRPVLVDRLARNFFAYNPTIHSDALREVEALREHLVRGRINPWSEHFLRTETEVVRTGDEEQRAIRESRQVVPNEESARVRVDLDADKFERYRINVLKSDGRDFPIVEGRDAFTIRIILELNDDLARVATYVVGKRTWDDWWDSVKSRFDEESVHPPMPPEIPLPSPQSEGWGAFLDSTCLPDDRWDNGSLDDQPDPRNSRAAVWTGSVMMVWGGWAGRYLDTGDRYDPATDTWSRISTAGAPSARGSHTAVWTGSEMVIWGGGDGRTRFNDGGRYDPIADMWVPTSTVSAPSPRARHTAVWTGSRMIVWGGGGITNDGGRYDPTTDSWAPTSTINAPAPRYSHKAVWTGRYMIVWGGATGSSFLGTGGRYDPVADTWMPTSGVNAPSPRFAHTAVWTGSAMIVWGGGDARTFSYVNTGGRYDPDTDTWTSTATVNAPDARAYHSAIWTGSRMVVWGGDLRNVSYVNSGGRYDPATDAWTPTSLINAPSPRGGHSAVWTGSLMVVWGGTTAGSHLNTGGRYDVITDTWTPTVTNSAPSLRTLHTAVWTGNLMVVWGGVGGGSYFSSGGRYDPVLDTWSPTSTINAPSPRARHTAVWTGDLMIVWGGTSGSSFLGTGGRYDPVADTWFSTATISAPSPRAYHSAIWTGSRLIIWGGFAGSRLNTGGRYDPASNTWTSTSTTNAPPARMRHTAVWTDDIMIVWGGFGNGSYLSSGGRYEPVTDTWAPTSMTNVPAPRERHSAVWTGQQMVIWAGSTRASRFMTGGRYNPATDTWAPTSTTDAPVARHRHTAVWTGNLMLVWGGFGGGSYLSSGGRYDPAGDTWSFTTTSNAPSARADHSAIWDGSRVVIWGGRSGSQLNSGGRYEPGQSMDVDSDGDGFGVCQGDCDDSNALIHPGATEACNGIDENCDGTPDEGFGVGNDCTTPLDDCNRVVGNLACRTDGTGTECVGSASHYDVVPPAVFCPPDLLLQCPASSADIGWATSDDACDSSPAVSNNAPSDLPLAETEIVWSAIDVDGNVGSCVQIVTVQDTLPPAIQVSAEPRWLWPPNHRLVPVSVMWAPLDACDPSPTVSLVSVESSEPDDAEGNGDGKTTDDVQVVADDLLQLRAERSGSGQGRVYTATYRASDVSGNVTEATLTVGVPHNVGGSSEPMMIVAEQSSSGTGLSWAQVPGALHHGVVRGNPESIKEKLNRYDLGQLTCIAGGVSHNGTAGFEDGEDPQLGKAFLYLAEVYDGTWSGLGTESAAKERSAAPGQANCR
jgi:N-acetylneuraminic acid mutarotase